MKKPYRRKVKNKDTILCDPAYWRLRAEIEAMKAYLETAYLFSVAASLGQKLDPASDAFKKDLIKLRKGFNEVVAARHGKLLEELENLSPELAAHLDSRGLDEIDTH